MRTILLSSLAVAMIACGGSSNKGDDAPPPTDDDDPPTPEEVARDYDELATVVSAHLLAEFPLQLTVAQMLRNEAVLPDGWVITGDDGLDTLGTGTFGGLGIEFAFHCNDASPEHLRVPCNSLANHGHIRMTITGDQQAVTLAMTGITRMVDWEVRDINLGKARFRGPDAMALETAVAGADVTSDFGVMFDAVYEKVRFMPDALFPTYGTINFTINTQRQRGDDLRVFDSTALLTFGASGLPTTLVFDGGVTYDVDVRTGVPTRL